MIVCPVCGFRNMDANARCFKCSALLKRDEALFREGVRTTAKRSRRDRIYRLLSAPLDWVAHHHLTRKIFALPENAPFRYPFTAGLLNLVPGMGYLYCGQPLRAGFTFLVFLALAALAVATIRHPYSNWLLYTLLGLFFILWADGIATAAKSNGECWRPRKTLALACAAMMMVGALLTAAQWVGMDVLTLQRITHSAMQPDLQSGDRVAVSDIPLWFREPRVGEVVMFNPPRFEVHQGANIFSINISKYLQRVLAGPGDRIAKKGAVYYRNDVELAGHELPFRGEDLPDFEILVPQGSYFIPVTGIPGDALASLMGSPAIGYVGEPGYSFIDFPASGIIPEGDISSTALAIASPPERRKWLNPR